MLLGGLVKLRPVTSVERDLALCYFGVITQEPSIIFILSRTKQSREQRHDGGEPFAPIIELLGSVKINVVF